MLGHCAVGVVCFVLGYLYRALRKPCTACLGTGVTKTALGGTFRCLRCDGGTREPQP